MREIEKTLITQNQDLDQILESRGMTRENLAEEIKLQKMVEAMAGEVEVSQEEVDQLFEQRKEALPPETDPEEMKEGIREY